MLVKEEEEDIQESSGASELLNSRSSRNPCSLLGYFLKTYSPTLVGFGEDARRSIGRAQFIYTSELGKGLKEGNWGNLDESLGFIGEASIDTVGSCNGFLLCCISGNMYEKGKLDYIVCNPVTREFRRLPRPHKAYYGVAVAFICKGNGATSLDDVRYEVIRAGINSRQLTTTLEMDTYSSVTGSWTEASVASDSPFLLLACNRSAFMVEEVTYWSAIESVVFDNRPSARYAILAYDRATENAQLLKMPVINGQRFASCGDILCPSEGKVLYARHDFEKIEIWVLGDYRRSEWKLEHRVTFVEINQQNCTNMSKSSSQISLEGFHPQNSQLLLLTWALIPFWYNIESKKLMGVGGGFIWSCCQDYFPYEWPLALEE